MEKFIYDLTFAEFDCNEYKSKTFVINYYDTSGNFIASSNFDGLILNWDYAVPGSVWYGVIESLKEYRKTKHL